LKAVAEFVENAIDAGAQCVTIVRGKDRGETYLRIVDDGAGIPRDEDGAPNFRYVATHICDSIKKRLKREGATGIQGEFGIGLLSFWTVGERLALTSTGADGRTWRMTMAKGSPEYEVSSTRRLVELGGVELEVRPLLPGLRLLTGEKIRTYLSSELRDRIRTSGVKIRIIDRPARAEYTVEPRRFSGRLLHGLPEVTVDDREIYVELYLNEHSPENEVALCRAGTRVIERITGLERFQAEPWTSGYLQGLIDAPPLNLTPGTRSGVIQDEAYAAVSEALAPLERRLNEIIEEQRRAEEESASRDVLKSVQKALREALLSLRSDEYDWFDLASRRGAGRGDDRTDAPRAPLFADEETGEAPPAFHEHAGPLHGVRIMPSSCVVPVLGERPFRAEAFDQSKRPIETADFAWRILEGEGALDTTEGAFVIFAAPETPGLVRLGVTAKKRGRKAKAEALITVAASLERTPPVPKDGGTRKGLPGYTFHNEPGADWRSRYDEPRNLIIVNKGHRDFVFASRNRARKLRYICRLFAKELILTNFTGLRDADLLERMVELSLYTEESL
jgi:hypothetical protein